MNTQDWSPLGWTGWTSLQSKGLSRVFSNTTVQKHKFFSMLVLDTLIMLFHLIFHKNSWYESIIHDFHPDYQRAQLSKQYSGLHNATHNAIFSVLSSS